MTLNVLSSAPHFNTQSRWRFMFHPYRLDYSTQGTNACRECSLKNAPQKSERACRPSLSNGFHCPGEPSLPGHPTTAGEYTTEAEASLHCPTGTVVWLNQETGVYHFRGFHFYGNTKHGAYMCERD